MKELFLNQNIKTFNMKKKMATVTIGIPAYNEEANIGKLLHAVLMQREKNFRIKEILVVSDATDNTNAIVKSFTDKRIKLLINNQRQGQTASQNRVFSSATSDIVVLLEADTLPQKRTYLYELLDPILANPKTGLVQGNVRPAPAKTIVGKTLHAQIEAHYAFMIRTPRIYNWFATGRGGRAYNTFVYTKLIWPTSVPEDVYALLWCKEKKIPTVFQKKAVSTYKIPEKLSDLVKERQKIKSGSASLQSYFSKDLIKNVYHRPIGFFIKPILYFFVKNPIAFLSYLVIKIYVYLQLVDKEFSDFWPTTRSTKSF